MPILVDEMFKLFAEMKRAGHHDPAGRAERPSGALSISDRAYIMDQGVIIHADTAANLLADKSIQERLLRGMSFRAGRFYRPGGR